MLQQYAVQIFVPVSSQLLEGNLLYRIAVTGLADFASVELYTSLSSV